MSIAYTWGSTPEERSLALPCDRFLSEPTDIFFRATSYIDRVLKGAAPGDLPAQAPVKFETAFNVKTAKALGLQIPPDLLALADEVVE